MSPLNNFTTILNLLLPTTLNLITQQFPLRPCEGQEAVAGGQAIYTHSTFDMLCLS